jgi:ATP-dependent exoDNAse (exonuclease V) alpha subunit
LYDRETKLRRVLEARALKTVDRPAEDWDELLKRAIANSGGTFDMADRRHMTALREQADALSRVVGRKLTVLVGKAGTGKTSVMGAVMLSEQIARGGILLLAPTGKARVQLGKAASAAAITIAQFLHQNGRYDAIRQRPLFVGKSKYCRERTVVIDECSMLTMDDLYAVLEALDLAHVQRIILVGDPNQLPPIGVGRPFADLVAHLDTTQREDADGNRLAEALARLSVVVRAASQEGGSDTLRLASWYTREPQAVDADRVLSDLEAGRLFNDLEIRFWRTADELHTQLGDAFVKHLSMASARDVAGFNASFGFKPNGFLDFADPSVSERWQILSPVRMQQHGVQELNRWVQKRYRAQELHFAITAWDPSLGDEKIVNHDKVILAENRERWAYHWSAKRQEQHYVANGEVGLMIKMKQGLVAAFAGRENLTFGFRSQEFSERVAPLQLAYALTVHKSQGSEFGKVFVVLPARTRLLTKELVYTALTRSKRQLVLFIEGTDVTGLFDLSKPERSETARRNTNLFVASVRPADDEVPFARHLIHKTMKGHLVRSKSELVIANMLFQANVPYEYERTCEGTRSEGRLRPDFSFVTPDGELIIWEHLGMMSREDYRRGWEWKKDWYAKNGFGLGKNLFTSEDDEKGALDSSKLVDIIEQIRKQL